jgi:hypothetical protein
MSFGKSLKIFQYNLLRQAGVNVTPQQVGLKTDPFAAIQAKSASSLFGNVLGQVSANGYGTGMSVPVPPTPPADPADAAAQAKYQQELLTYQSNFQLYNQRFMQLLLNQMSNMQISMQRAAFQNGNTAPSNGSDSSSSGNEFGIGSIL